MISKGALERVPDPGPGFYSRLFLVEKASGGWRPVIDLSPFNEFVQQTPFKMETASSASSVLLSVRKGDFLASIDLKDAYFQIPVHTSSGKWLSFVSDGTVHQFKVLCFGLSTAPQVFTRVFATVSAWAHVRGVRFLWYLDDWLVLASTEARARQHVQDLLSLCYSLGVVLNRQKSDLNPSQSVEYLGMTIDTVAARAYPKLPRIDKFIATARKFLSRRDPPAQRWQVLLGHMSSLEKLVPRGRLRMRSLQWHLKLHWSLERDPPNLPVPRSRQVEEDLYWWMVRDHLLERTPFGTPTPDLRLYSDASRAGWGAHLLDQSVLGVWSHQESSLRINLLELKALFLALRAFKYLITDHQVTAMCDNSTVVAYVNKQRGTVSDSLCSLTGQLLRWTESKRVQLEARYLPGQSNILANLLSRRNQVLGAEWSLHPQVARDLLCTWGSPTIDMFATHLNAKLPLYCSLIPDPQALFEDAFRHPWDNLDTYAFPPFHLVERVVARVRETPNLSMTLVAPLAGEGVVRRTTSHPDPTPSGTTTVGLPTAPTPLPPVPRRRPRPEPSRVAAVKRLLRKSGFSRGTALELSSCVREFTAHLYQSQWLSFCGWCRGRGITPIDATIPLIVDFLIHLRRDKGFSLSALKGYRSAINSVLALNGTDLTESRELTMLFRSFAKSCPTTNLRPRPGMSPWSLTASLRPLTSP